MEQNPNEKCCGQCCVAMITKRSLTEIVEKYGHNSTSTLDDVRKILKSYNYETSDIKFVDNRKAYQLPLIALVRIERKGRKNGHFILHYINRFYDSCEGIFYDQKEMILHYEMKFGGQWRIRHYIAVGNMH
ncbi:cysteine peptidase family C39 domain-containing protein [Bacillus salitolerans]|uniref:Cysteine peptidase family C39 domain-containing protein n=1 Tax=Bacillus salitolerans TaxID=1437434 RepID=A0ABW4LM55_9BACI